MNQRRFRMRLECRYSSSDNAIDQLSVENRIDDAWQPLELSVLTPGFDIFVYSVFTCQHTYFRINAAEAGLRMASSQAEIEIITTEDWQLDAIHVHFSGRLAAGSASQENIDHIIARMRQCPVSINLSPSTDALTTVEFI